MSARWLAAVLGIALLLLACDRSEDENVDVSVAGSPVPTASAAPGATATATPRAPAFLVRPPVVEADSLDPDDLRGFTHPVEGACLPFSEALMPNAPRAYRNGVHEGVDIYPGYACARVELNTPTVAMYDGVVVRADLDYVEISPEQVSEFAARTARQGNTDPETLDIYRGRQVWIDHGSGVVARYAHLASIADGIEAGAEVQQGQPIGGIGESGTPESVLAPGTDIHLHYEVRIGDSFLGDGLAPDIVRGLYERLFSDPSADSASGAPAPVFHVYTVKAGDTVSSVAEQFGLPVFLVVWNNAALETPGTPIEEGQLLRIPGADGIIHRVVAGETLSSIADRYGANVGSIVNFPANGLSDPNLLQVGATILVPGGRPPLPPPAAPTPEPTPQATVTPEPTPAAAPSPQPSADADAVSDEGESGSE